MIRWVRISRFSDLTGYTEKAVRRKIEAGVWPQGTMWCKAPDGSILLHLENFNRWAEDREFERSEAASRSTSAGRASAAVNVLPFDRQP